MSAEEIEAEEETVEGIGYMAYLSLRYHHAGISLKQVMGIVTPSRLELIAEAMAPNDEAKKNKKPEVPTKP